MATRSNSTGGKPKRKRAVRKATPKKKVAAKKKAPPKKKKAPPKADASPDPMREARDAAVSAYRSGESLPEAALDAMAATDPQAQRASMLADIAAALGVNDRQRRFAEILVSGTPGSRAYIEAGYDAKGNAAEVNAHKLLRNAKVAAFVKVLRLDASRAGIIDREAVLQYLSDVLRTPIGDVRADSVLCQKLAIDDKGARIEMPSKLGAVSELAKILGWYKEQTVQVQPMTDADLKALVGSSPALREMLKAWISEAENDEP